MNEHFGDHEVAAGRFFYDRSMRWEGGASIYFDEDFDRSSFLVEVPGGALSSMTEAERIGLLVWLARLGFKATRIDLALDFHGDDLRVVDCVQSSCMDGELARARTFQPRLEVSSGRVTARGVTIGKRGKLGSGRYVRVYDKGLETKTAPAKTWERYEVEFSDQAAMVVGDTLAAAGLAGWSVSALEFVLGAVDFRVSDDRMKELSRRSRVGWWEEVVGDSRPVCVQVKRDGPDLRRYIAWVQRCVAPTILEMMERTDKSLATIWHDLVGKFANDSADVRLRPVVWQYVQRELRKSRGSR